MSRTFLPDASAAATTRNLRLRQFLALDAAVTGANGLAYVFLPEPLEALFGVRADLLAPIGLFLIAFGVGVGVAAAMPFPSRVVCLTIIIANVTWAVASMLTLVLGSLSPTALGGIWIGTQAMVVGGFAVAQHWALRRLPS
ncbi:MAG: hypothetical protein M3313_14930 [Actinomycetota bacterium]|nr:hypothetical protein [Actinomycetota bacterium]